MPQTNKPSKRHWTMKKQNYRRANFWLKRRSGAREGLALMLLRFRRRRHWRDLIDTKRAIGVTVSNLRRGLKNCNPAEGSMNLLRECTSLRRNFLRGNYPLMSRRGLPIIRA